MLSNDRLRSVRSRWTRLSSSPSRKAFLELGEHEVSDPAPGQCVIDCGAWQSVRSRAALCVGEWDQGMMNATAEVLAAHCRHDLDLDLV